MFGDGIKEVPIYSMYHEGTGNARMDPKFTACSYLGPLDSLKRQHRTKVTPKQVSRRGPQVGFVIQALSDGLLGDNFG